MNELRIAGIVGDSIVDGPGLRLTVFVQGCSHHCKGCHNPETWDPAGGKVMSVDEIMSRLVRNPLLSGVTLSGGEPFEQAEALLPLARRIKSDGLEIAVYTGYVFEELIAMSDPAVMELLKMCDTLVDGPFIMAKRNLDLPFRGSENQRILDVQASLAEGKAVLDASGRWE